jgi:hypothetical protein
VEKGTIQIEKIPLQQKLWWKQLFVEGGLQLSSGVGLKLMYSIHQAEEMAKSGIKQTKQKREKIAKEYQKKPPEERKKSKENIKKIAFANEDDNNY